MYVLNQTKNGINNPYSKTIIIIKLNKKSKKIYFSNITQEYKY